MRGVDAGEWVIRHWCESGSVGSGWCETMKTSNQNRTNKLNTICGNVWRECWLVLIMLPNGKQEPRLVINLSSWQQNTPKGGIYNLPKPRNLVKVLVSLSHQSVQYSLYSHGGGKTTNQDFRRFNQHMLRRIKQKILTVPSMKLQLILDLLFFVSS